MTNYTNINSKLYSGLFELGGDNLLAVYCKLKFAKRRKIKIYKEQNKNIYQTLKTETNLSVTTLRRYIKVLSKENLCYFDTKGNFCMSGTNKINNYYKSKKTIRVEIGSYKETKLFSFRIRLKRLEQNQKNTLDRKYKQKNIMSRMSKGYFVTKQERRFLNNCEKRKKTVEGYTAKTVLSNQGYSKLKHGAERSKGSGFYWKSKLVKANIVQVKRRFKFLRKGTVLDYLENRRIDRTITYKNGRIFKELVPSFTTEIKEPTKQVDKLEHLSFDVIHWWSAQ